MILGLEIGLFIFGIIALVKGQMKFGEKRVVEGLPARLLGVLALTPLPIALLVAMLYITAKVANNPGQDPEDVAADHQLTLVLIEAGIVVGIAILLCVLGFSLGKPPQTGRRRRRDEDDEYDDRPARRSRRDEDDDDEYDDRPRRRRREVDDY